MNKYTNAERRGVWLTGELYPLKENEWFDGQEDTGGM